MFLIRNKLVATAVVLIVVIMMVLTRPGDFTVGDAYLMTHTIKSNDNKHNSSASISNNNTVNTNIMNNNTSNNITTDNNTNSINTATENIPYASNDVYVGSGDSNGLMNSYVMYKNNISNMLGLSEENKDKIAETLDDINWEHVFKRATSQLKSYGNEYENNGNIENNNNGSPSAANSANSNYANATSEASGPSAGSVLGSASDSASGSDSGSTSQSASGSGSGSTSQSASGSGSGSGSDSASTEIDNIFGDSVDKNDDGSYTLNKDFTLTQNIIFTETFTLYLENGITFDGGYDIDSDEGPTITYSGDGEWPGLFQLTAGSDASTHTNTVKNIKFILNGETLETGCGCIIGSGDINEVIKYYEMDISGCLTTTTDNTTMTNEKCGGITGKHFSKTGCECSIDNCVNEITISDNAVQSGGIVGPRSGLRGLTITNCVNTGNLEAALSGGICGAFAGAGAGTYKPLTISYCINDTTQIGDNGAGGICGALCGYNSGTVIISYCSSEGILGWGSGGLVGALAAYDCTNEGRSITVSYSYYQSDEETSSGCGGLFGKYTCGMIQENNKKKLYFDDLGIEAVISDTSSFTGEVNIYQCYSVFDSTSNNTGGIIMNDAASLGKINIYNTYFMGDIGSGNALVKGVESGYEENVTIKNCYGVGTFNQLAPDSVTDISASDSSEDWNDAEAQKTINQELPDDTYILRWYWCDNNTRWYIADDGDADGSQCANVDAYTSN
jgi:hypothetical protein